MKKVNNWQFSDDNEWYTCEVDVQDFLDVVKIPKDKVIWCPFDTAESAFVKVLKRNGYVVLYSHIINGQDFYEYEPPIHYDIILSNPPFKGKSNLLKRLVALGKPFGIIMGIQCFSSATFNLELSNLNNFQLAILVRRIKYHKGNEHEKLTAPNFHSLWICNDLLDEKLKIINNK